MDTPEAPSPPLLICQLLELDPAAEAHYSAVLSSLGVRDPWLALARAIAASPGWPDGAMTLVLRRSPAPPRLAVLGSFDPAGTIWLQAQALALSPACRDLRYIDYREAERACDALANLLLARLGTAGVTRSRFVAIPRGGLVVLGLLATRLGLRHDQLLPSPDAALDPGETLVVVDDCAVSGARLARFLEGCPGASPAVFACLYSPTALRPALEAAEPRLLAVLSAAELRAEEFAPGLVATLPAEPGVRRFWWGSPETLCLPWNEPDRLVWNPVAGRYDQSWRIVPPELCLKNGPAPGVAPVPIQIQPEARGPLKPSPRVVHGEITGRVAVCDLEAGRCFRLDGVGSDLWRDIVRHGGLEAAVERLGKDYDVSAEQLRNDALRFVRELLQRGLLEQSAPEP